LQLSRTRSVYLPETNVSEPTPLNLLKVNSSMASDAAHLVSPRGEKYRMTNFIAQRLLSYSLIPLLAFVCQPRAHADPTPVRHPQGTLHGFLELRSDDGHIIASGDVIQVLHGDRVTSETLFHFKDGSIDDEITVFSQRHTLQLISDHHVQKGPSFPHPMDVLIDAHSGQVTVRTTGKDGKDEATTDHLDLPPDLSNGLIPLVLENLRPNASDTSVSMVVATPKPRLVKLVISNRGDDTCSVVGVRRKAIHYEIKIELGGVAGVIAPLIGKAPPNIQLWVIGGEAPTFIKEQGPIYPEGPLMTIQLASPAWSDSPRSGD
jgi:hypothetical protein